MAALASAVAAVVRAVSKTRAKSRSVSQSGYKKAKAPPASQQLRATAANRKGRSRTRSQSRSGNDGAGNQRLSVSHGRSVSRMSNYKEAQMRQTLTPTDTASMVYTGSSQTAYGQCEYTCEESEVGNVADIDAVITNAKNNNDSEVKPGLTGKFFMQSYDMELKIVNATNSLCNIRVYEVMCRRDVPINIGSLETLCSVGWTEQAPSVGTPISKNWLGGTLYQNVGLTPFYKIIKDKRMTLAPGKELRLVLSHNKAKVMNPVVVNDANILALGGYTKAFVIQHWGVPIGDTSNPQVLSTSVSKIIWTVTKKYKYQEQYDNAGNTFELTPPIPTVFPTPTVLINQMDGNLRPEVRA